MTTSKIGPLCHLADSAEFVYDACGKGSLLFYYSVAVFTRGHLHFYCTALHFANCGMHLPQLNVTRVNTSCVVPALPRKSKTIELMQIWRGLLNTK